jgi:hypothetical protein
MNQRWNIDICSVKISLLMARNFTHPMLREDQATVHEENELFNIYSIGYI